MAAITSSLERSLRTCSLSSTNGGDSTNNQFSLSSGAELDLNSPISLPCHWEQCLDLKSGEVYYKNWKTGKVTKEVPRTTIDSYSEDDDSDDYDSSYEYSDESSSDSSPISYSRYSQIYQHDHIDNNSSRNNNTSGICNIKKESVLVVAGCKSCLMYSMVPKQDPVCPKCGDQLLPFYQSEIGSA